MPTFSRGSPSVADLTPKFVRYIEVDLCFARSSVIKYEDCLRQIIKMIGDRPVISYTADDILDLKSAMLRKNHSTARQVSILSALKRFLEFCSKHEGLSVIDPNHILVPKRPRREVAYLTVEEVERFVGAIRLTNLRDKISVSGLRFRALVEMLLGSAMRIGELLSLNRADIDFENREARIIGKGNKQRTVFFTVRALVWMRRYLDIRTDHHPALFVCQNGQSRLKQPDLWR